MASYYPPVGFHFAVALSLIHIYSRIGKIVMELYSVTPETLNQIWASVGAKYQPCLLYTSRCV